MVMMETGVMVMMNDTADENDGSDDDGEDEWY